MAKTATVTEEPHFILSSLPPSLVQKRLALAVVLALLTAFFITAGPLSSVQLPRVNAFVPAYAAAMFVNDSITAVLLFAQFSILHSRALLAIASGYLFTAVILIPWMLTFPGVFTPSGLLSAGPQSTAWLYILWHAGFPLFVIAYALLKDVDSSKHPRKNPFGATMLASMAVITGISVATFLIITGDAQVPQLMLDTLRLSIVWQYAAGSTVLLILITMVVLWVQRRSVLDLWLMVVMCAYAIEVFLISFPVPARYSVGWYAGRVLGLVSSSILLFVLLYEITTLYGQLLHAVLAQRRERDARLMTGDAVAATIAHEIRQPLAAMITNADAGLRWVSRSSPDLEEVSAALKRIVSNGHRAGAVIESTRAMFKRDARRRTSFDLNDLIGDAISLARSNLQKHRIDLQTELDQHLPQLIGDRTQLQQVLMNLITNAIESMASVGGARVLSIKSELKNRDGVILSLADTGMGIGSQDVERIFNPLFTTKSDGMGMGLSICRSIIEAHDGRLWVTPHVPQGAVFQFFLPSTVVAGGRG
jgi:signal transduction histidine kinase